MKTKQKKSISFYRKQNKALQEQLETSRQLRAIDAKNFLELKEKLDAANKRDNKLILEKLGSIIEANSQLTYSVARIVASGTF